MSAVSMLKGAERPRLGEATWATSLCECMFCGYKWQSVHPHGVELECFRCGEREAVRVDE